MSVRASKVPVARRLLRAHVRRRAHDHDPGLGEALVVTALSARAMPKSATSVLPSVVRSRFSGLMSRWITPWSWAYWRAWAASRVIRSASSTESCRSRRSRSRSDLALDEGHGEPELPGGLAGVVDREDVRVLQAGGGLDLALEAVGAERLGQLGMEHLERDRPLVPEVVGQKDRGHAPAPEFALEAVAISEGSGELSREIGHSRFRQGAPVRYRPEMRRARLRRTCPGP